MLKENCDSKSLEYGKRCGHFCKAAWRALFSTSSLLALLPVVLVAQAPVTAPQGTDATPVYGGGVQVPLLFEGEVVPVNQVSLSMGATTFYDDNVFGTNADRVSDEAASFDAHLGITKQSTRMNVSVDYTPVFLLYHHYDVFDRANHFGNLTLDYRLTSKFVLGLHDTASYQNGEEYAFPTVLSITAGPPSPSSIYSNLYTYTTRILSDASGLDLTYVKSRRASVTFSGGYSLLNYGAHTASLPLYNVNEYSGSLAFKYFLSEHTSFGILLLHQDSTYQGGEVFGHFQRSQVESSYLSLGFAPSPTVKVTVFGGPQYIDTVGQVSATGRVATHFQASGGGSVTKEVRKTAISATFQRSVTGSGGLYTSEISTFANFAVRRSLVGSWEADLHAGASREAASLFKLANGRTDGLFGGVIIRRPLRRGAMFHVSYESYHQLSSGTLPIFVNLDRNQIAAGIDYQFKPLPLGR